VQDLPVRSTSAWDARQISSFLQAAEQPLRLALVSEKAPLVVPLWYQFVEGKFWCASPRHAKVVRLIEQQPQCGFDVSTNEIPYRGVRGQGSALIVHDQGAPALQALIERYLKHTDSEFAQWLLSRADDEVAICLEPRWLTAWDFSGRMASV
jgi:nitroimidazol reductase NimA-like FMN-containing flavoprotein (pyridoxamine 5'-phosphate oxidase superfamily)